jgi:hypothetical protein
MDMLVSSLYTPQNEADVSKGATDVVQSAYKLCNLSLEAMARPQDDVVEVLEKLTLGAESTTTKPTNEGLAKEERWMRVWKEQMDKAETARTNAI